MTMRPLNWRRAWKKNWRRRLSEYRTRKNYRWCDNMIEWVARLGCARSLCICIWVALEDFLNEQCIGLPGISCHLILCASW
jgi:hypothetical protein